MYSRTFYNTIFVTCAILVVFSIYILIKVFIPLSNFPADKDFVIEDKQSGSEIFNNLKKEGFVQDVFWLKVLNKILKREKFYKGVYEFEKPESIYSLYIHITTRPVSLAVLIPEGFTKKQIAERLQKYIYKFDKNDFLRKAREGYLYPDTYFFFKYSTNDEIIKIFSEKFNDEMLNNFPRMPTEKEIIIASMLEREARKEEEMRIISGIIQNRLKAGMALQIDATVLYGQGAWKDRVLYKDLKTKNDYNTYQKTGLPIGPISNPGLPAIRAAMFPAKTKYFYYLTGLDGRMYYAVTHEEHVRNKLKYLR